MNIEKILQLRYSAYKWTVVNNDYDRLIWNDSNEIPKPTYDELVAISDDIKYLKTFIFLWRERKYFRSCVSVCCIKS